MMIGFTIRCSTRPSFIQTTLSGRSSDALIRLAARNSTASASSQGHARPECQTLIRASSAKKPAITRPKVRSEPGAEVSSRLKLSWVDWFIRNIDNGPDLGPDLGSGALSGETAKVPLFLTFSGRPPTDQERGIMQEMAPDQPASDQKSGVFRRAFAPRRMLLNSVLFLYCLGLFLAFDFA